MSHPRIGHTQSSESGFTLVEILVAILIVGLLASIAIPLFSNQYNRGATTELEASLLRSQMYLQEKKTENSGMYPRDFAQEELAFPEDANISYTFNADRTEYCLQGTNKRGTTRFVTSTKAGVSTDACTYPATSASETKPVLSATMVTDGTYQLTWNHSSPSGNYKVYKDGSLVKNVSGSTQYRSTTPLNTVSKFHIMAGSQKSNVVTLTPHAPAPKTAPVLSIMDTHGDKVEWKGMLNWTSVANATSYLVYDNKGNELTKGGTKENRFPVSTKIGTTRTFYVVAVNDLGKSPKSSVVTLQGPIPGGNVLKATPTYTAEHISLKLTWSPQDSKVNGSARYNVYQDGSLKTNIATKTTTIILNYDTGIKKFQVKGVGQNGVEGFDSNIIEFNTAVPTPPRPTVAAKGIKPAGAKYAPWVRVNNYTAGQYPSWAFSHWKTKYAVNGGTQHTSTIGKSVSGGWEATYSINPGETLRVYVVAVDILGRESPPSSAQNFTTVVPTPTVTVTSAITGRSVVGTQTHYTVTQEVKVTCPSGLTAAGTLYNRLFTETNWTEKSVVGSSNSLTFKSSGSYRQTSMIYYYGEGHCVTDEGIKSNTIDTGDPERIIAI